MSVQPPRRIALGFLLFAHLQFGMATLLIAWDPAAISGFFYHPKMIAVVHGLTLGWLSSGLIAIEFRRLPRSKRWFDRLLLLCWIGGASGLPSHFWIEEFGGMGWSAGLLVLTVATLAFRFLALASLSDDAPIVSAILSLAWINFLAIAILGLLIGLNRSYSIIPGFSLHHAFGHAHLAALGWVSMALLGIWLRASPVRPTLAPSIVLGIGAAALQLGTTAVSIVLFVGEGSLRPYAWIASIGLILTISSGLWIRRDALAPLSLVVRLLILMGCGSFLFAIGVGIRLSRLETATERPDWIMLYGVLGLLGALGSLIAAAVAHWLGRRGDLLAIGWIIGAPLTGYGLTATADSALRAGAIILTIATAVSGLTAAAALKSRLDGYTRTRSADG